MVLATDMAMHGVHLAEVRDGRHSFHRAVPPPGDGSYVARRTSHVARRTSYVVRRTSHVARRTSHVARRTSYVARRTSHVARRTSYVARRTSHVVVVASKWWSGGAVERWSGGVVGSDVAHRDRIGSSPTFNLQPSTFNDEIRSQERGVRDARRRPPPRSAPALPNSIQSRLVSSRLVSSLIVHKSVALPPPCLPALSPPPVPPTPTPLVWSGLIPTPELENMTNALELEPPTTATMTAGDGGGDGDEGMACAAAPGGSVAGSTSRRRRSSSSCFRSPSTRATSPTRPR